MKPTTVIILFILIALTGAAREITGSVVDDGGRPMEFVNVVLMHDSTFIDGKITDAAGVFRFESADPKGDVLRVSMTGYEPLKVAVPADGNVGTLTLAPSSVRLGEVEVKADLPVTTLKGNAMVTKIENTMLATLGSANDVLQNLPMLTGDNGNFNVFGSGRAVIYINNRRVRDAQEIGQLDSKDIRSVEVISNPGARYGAQTRAVIRIFTRRPVGDGLSYNLFTDNYINKGFTTSDYLGLKYRTGGFEVFANGQYDYGKTYHDEHDITQITTSSSEILEDVRMSNINRSHGLMGKVGFSWQPNVNHSLGAYYQYNYSRWRGSSKILSEIMENDALTELTESDGHARSKTRPGNSANIYYNGRIAKFTIDANGDYMERHSTHNSVQNERGLSSGDRTVTIYSPARSRLLAEKVMVSYDIPGGDVTVGEEYTDSRRRSEFLNPENIIESELSEVRENNLGIFAEASRQFGKFYVNAGLRYEHVNSKYFVNGDRIAEQSRTYNNLFPSASVSYSDGDWRASISYSDRIDRPSYSLLSGNYNYINSISYTRGNPYLRPEKIRSIGTQATWKFLMLSVQYNYTKDVIIWVHEPYRDNERITVSTSVNKPNTKDLAVLVGASPKFGVYRPSAYIGFTRHWFKIDYLGRTKHFDTPAFMMQLTNRFDFPHDWHASVMLWWTNKNDWNNTSYTSSRSLVNLRLYKMFFNQALTVYLEGNDIFNGRIERLDAFSGNVRTHTSVDNHGRNFGITVVYRFNQSKSRYKGTGAGGSEKSRL